VTLKIDCIFVGHGSAINEVKTHTVDDGLVLSASKDERLAVRFLLLISSIDTHRIIILNFISIFYFFHTFF
jgi:hypothetical protein